MMRKLILKMSVSADGFVGGPNLTSSFFNVTKSIVLDTGEFNSL
jgi:hypothetical protein